MEENKSFCRIPLSNFFFPYFNIFMNKVLAFNAHFFAIRHRRIHNLFEYSHTKFLRQICLGWFSKFGYFSHIYRLNLKIFSVMHRLHNIVYFAICTFRYSCARFEK